MMTEFQNNDIRMVYGNDIGTYIIDEILRILNRVLVKNNDKVTLQTRNDKGVILSNHKIKYFVLSNKDEKRIEISIGTLESKDSKTKHPVVRISNKNPILIVLPPHSVFASKKNKLTNVILNGDTILFIEKLLNAEIALCYGETPQIEPYISGLIAENEKVKSRKSEEKEKQIIGENANKNNENSGIIFLMFGVLVAIVGLFINAGIVIIGIIIFFIGSFMIPTPENVNSSPNPDFATMRKDLLGSNNNEVFDGFIHGKLNEKLICPHCRTKGTVRTKRYERKTKAYCYNCESRWFL